MTAKMGTLYLQTRSSELEEWATLNQLDFSSELGYFDALAQLENFRAGYTIDHRFTGHSFNIKESSNEINR
jgi:hypothetical protein